MRPSNVALQEKKGGLIRYMFGLILQVMSTEKEKGEATARHVEVRQGRGGSHRWGGRGLRKIGLGNEVLESTSWARIGRQEHSPAPRA